MTGNAITGQNLTGYRVLLVNMTQHYSKFDPTLPCCYSSNITNCDHTEHFSPQLIWRISRSVYRIRHSGI